MAAIPQKDKEQLRKAFRKMMKTVFSSGDTSLSVEILNEKNVSNFISAHSSALDSSFAQVPMSDVMRRSLQSSTRYFSGMKTFHELNEAFPSLIDENGNKKSFERFLNDVRTIHSTYNERYLRAEYNFAHASAQGASAWEQIQADGDNYNLQYRTAQDSRVRPDHAALNGVTLPPSDSFWEQFYPPNGWNCRCRVVQVRKSKYPETDKSEAIARGNEALANDTKRIFRFNPGKERQIFPDYNPYTISRCQDCNIANGSVKLGRYIPDHELCNACEFLRNCNSIGYSPSFKNHKKELIDHAEKIVGEYSNLVTGAFYQTKKSFKRGISHARNIEEVEMFSTVNSHIDQLEFLRESPLGEGKDLTNPEDLRNLNKKKERGVTGYNVYRLIIDDITWIIKTEVYKTRTESIYHIKRE